MKMKHFKKYWGELYQDVQEQIETIVSMNLIFAYHMTEYSVFQSLSGNVWF